MHAKYYCVKIFLCSFLFFNSILLCAENLPIVKINEIAFTDSLEKRSFYRVIERSDSTDLFNLLYATQGSFLESKVNADKKKFLEIITTLKEKGIEKKNESGAIKLIYKTIHEEFFKKYETSIEFSKIFENGYFNCVTASALYAMVLEELKIPYVIKELTNHVYIVAYPNSTQIMLETTNPVKGYLYFTPEFVKAYLDELYKMKLISESEYQNPNKNEIFSKYYFSAEDISLKKLCGLQYYNAAIGFWEKEKYQEANTALQKAYMLYPCNRTKYMLKQSMAYLLDKSNYQSERDVRLLAAITRFNTTDNKVFDEHVIKDQYIRLTSSQLTKSGNFDQYRKFTNILKDEIKDTSYLKEILFIHHYEMARTVISNMRNDDAEPDLKMAFKLNPNYTDLHGLVIYYYTNKIRKVKSYQEAHSKIKDAINNFPFIETTDLSAEIIQNTNLDLMYRAFQKNDVKNGEVYQSEFEKSVLKLNKKSYNSSLAEMAFAEASYYYYRKGNVTKTKAVLEKGISYLPDSYNLKDRYSNIK